MMAEFVVFEYLEYKNRNDEAVSDPARFCYNVGMGNIAFIAGIHKRTD